MPLAAVSYTQQRDYQVGVFDLLSLSYFKGSRERIKEFKEDCANGRSGGPLLLKEGMNVGVPFPAHADYHKAQRRLSWLGESLEDPPIPITKMGEELERGEYLFKIKRNHVVMLSLSQTDTASGETKILTAPDMIPVNIVGAMMKSQFWERLPETPKFYEQSLPTLTYRRKVA